jgi:transposase
MKPKKREARRRPRPAEPMWRCTISAPSTGLNPRAKKAELSAEELVKIRQEKARKIFAEFYAWLAKKKTQVVPKSLLGKAVNYALSQWARLLVYLDHGSMTPDNNRAENAIRPFVLGRKNWLFAGTPEGAQASGDLFSLIETAKANGLEPYKYLRYLFEKIPCATSEDDYRALLPSQLKPADLDIGDRVTGV